MYLNLSIVMKFINIMILNCLNTLVLDYNNCKKDIFHINFNK
ncbi:hypothetical protein SAMN04488128_104197 [Chitinophaga eiseniae]|uniref:Uncharacterized protein n=1 Tax=Chitinophaga eiseniae TaxID=634771 RepID=A0A1T4T8S3_9BACT|nr:hypothetical protein SAMN04488128_104197 [Chitinophaga eiseniae]